MKSTTTGDVGNTGIDEEMADASLEDDDGVKYFDEAVGNNTQGDDDANNNNYQGQAVIDNIIGEENDSPTTATLETILQMLTISAGDGSSLFTSWEPGRVGQFYFMTTSELEDRAAEWLDNTMNTLLNIYGLKNAHAYSAPIWKKCLVRRLRFVQIPLFWIILALCKLRKI